MINTDFKNMTYKEFFKYCEERACDGRWSLNEASTCLAIIDKIEAIKVKGFFKKKQTEKAKEEAWQQIIRGIN